MRTMSKYPKSQGKKISKALTADKSPRWKGGKWTDTKGYVRVKVKSHPYSNCRGYVLEHRLVMENWLRLHEPNHESLIEIEGILYLMSGWIVHHINGIKEDNRIENLDVMKHGEHSRLNMKNIMRGD